MKLDDKLREWQEVRQLLFRVKDSFGKEQLKLFKDYLEARNLYELHYRERFDKLKMPY